MKRKLSIIVLALFFGTLIMSSCRSKKPGIVPCPSYSSLNIELIDLGK